jgi:hypothetical protein
MTVVINGSTGITSPSPFVLEGSTSGTVTVAAPAVAGTNTQTLVAATGTLAPLIADTAKSATGTSVDFTGIPSWVKRITVMFNGVSGSGTSQFVVQLGDSGGVENTGYSGSVASTAAASSFTSYFQVIAAANAAAILWNGLVTIVKQDGNTWVETSYLTVSTGAGVGSPQTSGGVKTLSDTLTQVRITTVNGTDTFDAGTINILYE